MTIPTIIGKQTIMRDVVGRLKMSAHQNIYDADFEYGPQPMRWEPFTTGAATITHLPSNGGVRLRVTNAAGDVAIRQSRPYHRYQPGKTMFIASAVQFGAALTGNVTRVGMFDDGNGVFFMQGAPTAGNPFGMSVVYRSDSGGYPVDTVIPFNTWNGEEGVLNGPGPTLNSINWNAIQMIFIEFAWYGAGTVRWGVFINGEPVVLHQKGFGNTTGQTTAWSRTGNLPARYEQRNIAAITNPTNDLIHYGLSVVVEGRVDDQRGFTYSYGMARSAPLRTVSAGVQFPVLSIRSRIMGNIQEQNTFSGGAVVGNYTVATRTGAAWAINQWSGLYCYFSGGTGGNSISGGQMARIVSNTVNTLTLENNVIPATALAITPDATTTYTIGLPNRGQLLPRQLYVQSSAVCVVELIASTYGSPNLLTSPVFNAMNTLGSNYSYAERDVSATALSGGEVVFAFVSPNNQLQCIDLSNLFPLFNNIRGNQPDILTVAVTGTANVGCHFVGQEAMS